MDDITNYFVHPTITPIEGEPNRESMRNLQRKIYENTISVLCELGEGMHGCLGVAISDQEHTSKFGSSFTPCVHPGPLPTYPQNAT